MAIRDTTVVWFNHLFTDAPVVRGEAGAMIELLDACLDTGFCVRSFDSVTVVDGVATLNMAAGVPYEQHAVIEIRDNGTVELNRRWRVDSVTSTSLKFTVDELVPDGTYSGGAATVRYAPAGWEKAFYDAGTHRAAYRSTALSSTQMLLFVDDSHAQYVRVRGYESMTDIDTPGAAFPTLAQAAATAANWPKSNQMNAASRAWAFVADSAMMYPYIAWSTTYPYHDAFRFGDFVPFIPNDAHFCCIAAQFTAAPTVPNAGNTSVVGAPGGTSVGSPYAARVSSGAGAAAQFAQAGAWAAGQCTLAPADGHLKFSPVLVINGGNLTTSAARGMLPGLLFGLERTTDVTDYSLIELPTGLHMQVRVGNNVVQNAWIALQIEGPWR